MECDQCGAPRPRFGPCPECGAPPPRLGARGGAGGSGARGRSQPGSSSSGSRRTSGTNWGAGGGGGGGLLSRDSGSRRYTQGSGDGWDDEAADYGGAPARSGGRFGSGEYGGVDPSRALVPQYDEVMPPSAEGGMMSGLPGFPQTDDEERAIGLRRPAYIPATEPRRKKKLSSGRVVSGVLSILLVTVGVCGGLGFLGQQRLAKLFSGPLGVIIASPTVDLSQVPVTPVATSGPAGKIVASVTTAQAIDANKNPINVTSRFTVGSTVYVVVNLIGVPQNKTNTVTCVFYLDDLNYQLKDGTTAVVPPSSSGTDRLSCALPYYQTGVGMVRVYWNRPASDKNDSPSDPYLATSIKFGVFAKIPATATPAGTPKSGTPSPSPTKKTGATRLPVAWRAEPGAS